MKREHVYAAGGTAVGMLALLIPAGFEVWDRIEKRHVIHDNQAIFECEVKVCEARGGHWMGTRCVGARRAGVRR